MSDRAELDLVEELARAMKSSPYWMGGDMRARDYALTILARLDSLGYAVCPKEPTGAMCIAGHDVVERMTGRQTDHPTMDEAYRAMIAAASPSH